MKHPESKKSTAGREIRYIPAWLLKEENYVPSKKKDKLLKNTHIKLLSLMNGVKNTPIAPSTPFTDSVFPIITVLYCIVLASLAQNMFFVYCLTAVLLLRCCMLTTKQLQQVMGSALSAGVLSTIVLLPAAFLGSSETLLRVSIKVFFSVGLLRLLAVTIPWNKLTKSLRKLHVPALFILTLDVTISYIVILGNISLHMLDAISLRAVGKWPKNSRKTIRNSGKEKVFAGIAATAFLRSRQMAEETHMAMICRGFDGEYKTETQTDLNNCTFTKSKKSSFTFALLIIVVMMVLTIVFLYLEGVVFS